MFANEKDGYFDIFGVKNPEKVHSMPLFSFKSDLKSAQLFVTRKFRKKRPRKISRLIFMFLFSKIVSSPNSYALKCVILTPLLAVNHFFLWNVLEFSRRISKARRAHTVSLPLSCEKCALWRPPSSPLRTLSDQIGLANLAF